MFEQVEVRLNIPYNVMQRMLTLRINGFECYIVGGASLHHFAFGVLDCPEYSNPPADYDLFTNATAEELMTLFQDAKAIGGQERLERIFTVITSDNIEISSYRSGGKREGLGNNILDHLRTCDFSINAIAIDIHGNAILPLGVINHIINGQLVAMGRPKDRIDEDNNRIMRAFRVTGKYGLYIEKDLYNVLQNTDLSTIPAENIRDEFFKLLQYEHGLSAFILSGKFFELFPEMLQMQNLTGRGIYHEETVWEHSLQVYKEMCKLSTDPLLRFCALFHDYGKPAAYDFENKKFTGHDAIGASEIQRIFDKLKMPNKEQKFIRWIIENHMWGKESISTRRRKWYKFFNGMKDAGVDFIQFALLQYADTMGRMINGHWLSEKDFPFSYWLNDSSNALVQWWDDYRSGNYPQRQTDIAINGNDLIEFGIKPSEEIGKILQRVYEMVLVGEIKNDKEHLLALVKRWIDRGVIKQEYLTSPGNVN